ncbi:Predicted dehydrogenase [Devosia enhydra]|uniref:Predicted dehydrogenase n=1 Tax=Devosia enhydra TaxID=665118 RepID=A0A1K2HZK8_9HYPH|nr:Gfo/Idh/MocA family oxidoreductase [Devosia enhydra]SFZ84624.1 Predicted dehydrogenase [Devosia enhydra]
MRVGIVGTAFGETRCKMIAETPEASLTVVCGRDPDRTSALAARYGAAAETSWERMIGRDDVDVVAVYTSTDLHGPIAAAAAAAGKHVIVSKPTAVTLDEARAMLRAARAGGVQLVVEFDTRYLAAPYRIHKAIAEGRLGPLIQGEYANKCLRGQDYYDEGSGWRGKAEMGGGCLLNQGVHAIDHMLWYQGRVDSVMTLSGTYAHDIEAEDAASAVVRFVDGSIATLSVTTTFASGLPAGRYGGGGTLKRAQVHGRDGAATVEGNEVTHWSIESPASSPALPDHPPLNVFQDLAWSLADPDRRSTTLVSGLEALESVYLTTALRQSAATGAPVYLASLGHGAD